MPSADTAWLSVARTESSTLLVSDATAVASVADNVVPAGIVTSRNSRVFAGGVLASSFGVGAGGAAGAGGADGALPSGPAAALPSASRTASPAGDGLTDAICDLATSIFTPSRPSTTTCSALTSTSLPATDIPSFFWTVTSVPTGGNVSGERSHAGRISANPSTIASFFIPLIL